VVVFKICFLLCYECPYSRNRGGGMHVRSFVLLVYTNVHTTLIRFILIVSITVLSGTSGYASLISSLKLPLSHVRLSTRGVTAVNIQAQYKHNIENEQILVLILDNLN
jgi:hypothetical protein